MQEKAAKIIFVSVYCDILNNRPCFSKCFCQGLLSMWKKVIMVFERAILSLTIGVYEVFDKMIVSYCDVVNIVQREPSRRLHIIN
jgi:hypothetical protein